MILSVAHRFVFVKGRKVAGTSIEMALAAICGPDDIVAPIMPVDERERMRIGAACRNYGAALVFHRGYLELLAKAGPDELAALQAPDGLYFNHMRLSAIEQRYPHPLDDFRVVCAERSPYAKIMSWLNMQESVAAYRAGGDMRGEVSRLQAAFDRLHEGGHAGAVKNIGLYRNRAGAMRAEVLRYETLQDDFAAFMRSLGCASPPLPHAKKGLMSDRLDPREVFRRDQLDLINAVYAEEFEIFGYPRL